MKEARTAEELHSSICNGRFTLDGSKLAIKSMVCSINNLTSLVGCPTTVVGDLYTQKNKLTNFEGAPRYILGHAQFSKNPITTLHNIHTHINEIHGDLYLDDCPIESCVLGLLKIKGLKWVGLINIPVSIIINKYLRGSRDVLDCAEELIEAGFEEYAQL